MIAGGQQHHRTVRGGHSRSEGQAADATFQLGNRPLKALPRRIAAPRVIELAPHARSRLHKRRSDMNRRDHRARLRVTLLTDVDGAGAEVHEVIWDWRFMI